MAAKQVRSRGTVCIAVNVTDGLTFMNSYGIAYRDLCSKARSTIMSTQRQVVLMQQKGKQTQVCSSESTRNQADVLRVNKYNLRVEWSSRRTST